jgi:hypothetical protein
MSSHNISVARETVAKLLLNWAKVDCPTLVFSKAYTSVFEDDVSGLATGVY